MERTYPASTASAGLRLFLGWFGRAYARSTLVGATHLEGNFLTGELTVGRNWRLAFVLADTVASEATVPFEAARAAVEQNLDEAGLDVVLWLPRGARLPEEPAAVAALVAAVREAGELPDGRRELRLPVNLQLRRTATTGSVVTILGGLAAHWAQFTNRVPGSFMLNSAALSRLPALQEERDALAERIVLAAGQPTADESQTIAAEDAWTVTTLDEGGSCVVGSPRAEGDEQSAALRRDLRATLREVADLPRVPADARALIVLGAATYGEEEKLTWALRGMDPRLYAGYDIVAVIADGLVKPLLNPAPGTLAWDAPLPGR